ncbi:MAG: PIN domain-containing protein [Treponema sp.]|jgi:predicted nucleic-acid-binding protein|nr:PIN domain-containing protein [Treponema sp.]
MPSLDTNCLLRWLLGDIPEQTALVTALVDSGETLAVADVALIETVFVLEKLKKISRETIKKAVTAVIGTETILCNRELFIEILPIYTGHSRLSFVDCYLEVLARSTGAAPLLTFDKKLANQLSGAQLLSS